MEFKSKSKMSLPVLWVAVTIMGVLIFWRMSAVIHIVLR